MCGRSTGLLRGSVGSTWTPARLPTTSLSCMRYASLTLSHALLLSRYVLRLCASLSACSISCSEASCWQGVSPSTRSTIENLQWGSIHTRPACLRLWFIVATLRSCGTSAVLLSHVQLRSRCIAAGLGDCSIAPEEADELCTAGTTSRPSLLCSSGCIRGTWG